MVQDKKVINIIGEIEDAYQPEEYAMLMYWKTQYFRW